MMESLFCGVVVVLVLLLLSLHFNSHLLHYIYEFLGSLTAVMVYKSILVFILRSLTTIQIHTTFWVSNCGNEYISLFVINPYKY